MKVIPFKGKIGKVKSIPTESMEQKKLVAWANLKNIPLVKHANEGRRTPQNGARLRDEGLRAGYPDLFCCVARGGYFGAYIEMKRNRPYTDSERRTDTWIKQEAWLTYLRGQGYYAEFAFGFDDAREQLSKYFTYMPTIVTGGMRK
jgi:hypothetical protein